MAHGASCQVKWTFCVPVTESKAKYVYFPASGVSVFGVGLRVVMAT